MPLMVTARSAAVLFWVSLSSSLPSLVVAQGTISPVRIVSMEYPVLARQAQIQGVVRISAEISGSGDVGLIKLSSGPPILADAAQKNLLRWKFSQATHLESESRLVNLVYTFVLEKRHSGTTETVFDSPNRVSVLSSPVEWMPEVTNDYRLP